MHLETLFDIGDEVTWGSGKLYGRIVRIIIERNFGELEIEYEIQNPVGRIFNRLEKRLRRLQSDRVEEN
jgi:hypothetical protein